MRREREGEREREVEGGRELNREQIEGTRERMRTEKGKGEGQ